MRNLKTKAMLALAVPGLLATTVPAAAQSGGWSPYEQSDSWNHSDRGRHRGHDRGYDRGYQGRYQTQSQGGYYGEPVYANTRTWRGDDGRYYCRRSNGTTGLIVGGAAGALIGREIAGRGGDRTLGAILGAAGGALLGRAVDRGGSRCR